jgi:hypothetical protein
VIIEEGPAHIIMPDGTEFDVVLTKRHITFDADNYPIMQTFTPVPAEEA